jgi:tetratricopeptide (TPR) repeat protein
MTNRSSKSRIIVGIIVIILIVLVIGSIIYTEGKEKYNNLGIEEYKKGNYNKAISYFDKAIESDTNNAFAYNNRGLAHSELK